MKRIRAITWILGGLMTAGCGDSPSQTGDAPGDPGAPLGEPGGSGTPASQGLAILGGGTHAIDNVTLTVAHTGHQQPSDLAFHPSRRHELWVTNRGDHSMWIGTRAAGSNPSWQRRNGGQSGRHFMARPASLDFAPDGRFTTAQDENGITQFSTPATFMGPTLWSSNLNIFDGGHHGHLDMLHNSPSGKGVAWDRDNAYWYFDGHHSSITRYDFKTDHGPGGTDHRDGVVSRYAEGQVAMVEGVPSHMVMDHDTDELLIADSGNNRIAVMDTGAGTAGSAIGPNYDGSRQFAMNGVTLTTLIEGSEHGMARPSGIELHDGHIFVSDSVRGIIYGFTREGTLVDYLNTGLPNGALAGITFDDTGRLWFVDMAEGRVLHIAP